MTTGEPSPWGPGPPAVPPDPYAGSYAGPWEAQPAPPWLPAGPSAISDEQLRRLPPPVAGLRSPGPASAHPDQRPALVGLAVTLAVTGALLWVCGLSLFLMGAVVGTQALANSGANGYVFHLLDEVVLRMGDGLWLPLYGFPVASLVTGFMLLVRRPWTRLAHTGVGVVALGWAGWWLRGSLLAWVVVAVYVGTSVAVLWAPSVGRWYADRPGRPRPGDFRLEA